MVFTLHHSGHVGAHLQKNFNELLLLCAPTWLSWPFSFKSHRTEGHVSENHLLTVDYQEIGGCNANSLVLTTSVPSLLPLSYFASLPHSLLMPATQAIMSEPTMIICTYFTWYLLFDQTSTYIEGI